MITLAFTAIDIILAGLPLIAEEESSTAYRQRYLIILYLHAASPRLY